MPSIIQTLIVIGVFIIVGAALVAFFKAMGSAGPRDSVTIAQFSTPGEGEAMRLALESQGVAAGLISLAPRGRAGSGGGWPVDMFVAAEDAERAVAVIKENESA